MTMLKRVISPVVGKCVENFGETGTAVLAATLLAAGSMWGSTYITRREQHNQQNPDPQNSNAGASTQPSVLTPK